MKKRIELLDGKIFSIDECGQYWLSDANEIESWQIDSAFVRKYIGELDSKVTAYQRVFDLLGENYFYLKDFVEKSYGLGINPMPQLRNRWREINFSFEHVQMDNLNGDFSPNKEMIITLHKDIYGQLTVAILPPKPEEDEEELQTII